MKKCFFIFFFLFSLLSLQAEKYAFENKTYIYSGYFIDLKNPGFYFLFKDGSFEITEPVFGGDEENRAQPILYTAPYTFTEKDGFLYLHTGVRQYLVLCSGEVCILNTAPFLFQPQHQSFSSVLSETIDGVKVSYNRENKRYYLEINPWVEDAKGGGIGEMQTINVSFGSDTFLFLNGFIDSARPDLYLKNSRIKELIVRNGTFTETITLKDSPEPQILQLARMLEGTVSFEIKSVYKGTKYDDTAMSE